MKNKNQMHWKDQKEKYQKILLVLFIMMSFYGCYKNGLSYYFLGKMEIIESLKPFLFPIIGGIISSLISKIRKRECTLESVLLGVLCGLIIPPMFPIWLFSILCLFFFLCLTRLEEKYNTISYVAIFKLLLILLSNVMSLGMENRIEQNNSYLYGMIDVFFGKGIGNIGTTNICLIVIGYLILASDIYYKKELPIYAFFSYAILNLLGSFLSPNVFLFKDILNSSFFFVIVFLLPISKESPAARKEQILYGSMVGIFSFILIRFFKIFDGAFLALLLVNLIWNVTRSIKLRQYK